jgi:hypothetical protein
MPKSEDGQIIVASYPSPALLSLHRKFTTGIPWSGRAHSRRTTATGQKVAQMCEKLKRESRHGPSLPLNTLQLFLANLVIVCFLYSSLQALIATAGIRLDIPPIHPRIAVWFQNYGVFRTLVPENSAFMLYGTNDVLEEPPKRPTENFTNLNLYDYFRTAHGEADSRANVQITRNGLDYLVRRVLELHNASDGAQVERVFVYKQTWPQSPDGFWAKFEEGEATLVATGRRR